MFYHVIHELFTNSFSFILVSQFPFGDKKSCCYMMMIIFANSQEGKCMTVQVYRYSMDM